VRLLATGAVRPRSGQVSSDLQEETGMSEQNESLVRGAYEAYSRGDIARLLEIIDPGLEWTYLDPSVADPEPQTCHGREQLQWALQGQAERVGFRNSSCYL
jgi:hypothetical protein